MTTDVPIGEMHPWMIGSYAPNHHPETYSVLDYSPERLIDITRQMEWTEYEVDPAWRNFCEFSHKDIGGPFEKLGIIRRKPKLNAVFMSPDMMNQIEKVMKAVSQRVENEILYGHPRSVFGVPVYESRYLPSRTIIEWRDV